MNENYNNQCQKQGDQNYEIGCGCSGILQYFNKLLNDAESLANESQEYFEKTDELLSKTQYAVEQAQRTLSLAQVRFNAAVTFLNTGTNGADCICTGTDCSVPQGQIPGLITDIQTALTNLEATLPSSAFFITALAQYEQLLLLLEQFEQCIRCGFCQDCSCNGSGRATCNCPARTTCNCPRI